MYNRLEFPFQPVFCLQSLPRKAHKAGRSVGMGSSFPMVAPRKARPRLQPQNGTQLPQRGSSGKRIPKSMPNTVRSFPMGAASESLSRNEPSERNTLSETRPNGKLGTSDKISDPIWVQEGVRCIRKRSARGFSGSSTGAACPPRRLQEPAAFPEQGQPVCLAQAGGGGRADRP